MCVECHGEVKKDLVFPSGAADRDGHLKTACWVIIVLRVGEM